MFDPQYIEQQLISNFQKQTLNFTNCITSYQVILKEWNDLRLCKLKMESEIAALERQINDPNYLENIKKERLLLEKKNIEILEELDIMKNSVDDLTINFNDALEKYNEEKKLNDDLTKQITAANELIFNLKQTVSQNEKTINFLNEQLESLKQDKDKMSSK